MQNRNSTNSSVTPAMQRLITTIAALAALLGVDDPASGQDGLEIRVSSARIPDAKADGRAWDPLESPTSLPDCYVIVEVNGTPVLKTRIVHDSGQPVWNASGAFHSSYYDELITITLYDADIDWGELAGTISLGAGSGPLGVSARLSKAVALVGGDDLIGQWQVQLDSTFRGARVPLKLSLHGDVGTVGSIQIEVRPR